MSPGDWSNVCVPNFLCPVGSDGAGRMSQVEAVEGSLNTSKHTHTVCLLASQQPHWGIPLGASQPDAPAYYMPTSNHVSKRLQKEEKKGAECGLQSTAETHEVKLRKGKAEAKVSGKGQPMERRWWMETGEGLQSLKLFKLYILHQVSLFHKIDLPKKCRFVNVYKVALGINQKN